MSARAKIDDAALNAALLAEARVQTGLLREIVAELRLRGDAQSRPALRAQDMDALRKLLPVLAALYGVGGFTVGEVMESAAERSPTGADLRVVIGSRKAQSLGKLLERAVGHVVDGLTVERAGHVAGGALWRCVGSPLAIETPAVRGR